MDKNKSIVMNREKRRPTPRKTQLFSPRKSATPTRRVSKKYVRISTCHDFQWSRGLWREASREIVGTATLCLFAYVFAASLLAYFDGVRGVDIPYFIAACVTTVGIGDIHPHSQAHRAATVLMLPFGLLIISLCLSAAEARAKATAPTMDPEDLEEEERENNSVNIGSIRNERSLKKMHVWYKKKENRGAETRQKLVKIFLEYMLTLAIGCSFFLLFTRERRLQEQRRDEAMTVVDAMYYASLAATSVGYGHRIVPQTDAAKGFLTVYFFSTVVVARLVGKLVNITFERNQMSVEDEIVRETIWVHRTALLTDKTDEVTEPDYLMFKLMQMQRVDENILHRLQERFDVLDNDRHGALEISVEIPSSGQLKAMENAAEEAGEEATEKWLHEEWRKMRKKVIDERYAIQAVEQAAKFKAMRSKSFSQSPASSGQLVDAMLISVAKDCCEITSAGDHIEIHVDHIGFTPLRPALESFFKSQTNPTVCGPALSARAAITLDEATRKIAGIPVEATTFAFAFPLLLDRNLIQTEIHDLRDPSSGPCHLPLNGAFVYFDRLGHVASVNCLIDAPPEQDRPKRAAVLQFEKPLDLPQATVAALAHRFRPTTQPTHIELGAVAFTWINRAENLPGIKNPPSEGAFAFILKGGRSVYFPIRHRDSGIGCKVSEIHDFAYSRALWFQVCKETVYQGAAVLAAYILVGYYAICKTEGWDSPTSWYFLSTTFTTVGYGDYAPTKQLTRAIAIGLLPLGLIVVGIAISANQAYKLSKPPRKTEEDPVLTALKVFDPKKKDKALMKLIFEEAALFDIDDDGRVAREEVVQMAPVLSITPEQAGTLFDKLDVEKKGYIVREKEPVGFFSTIPGRLLYLCFDVYIPVFIAAAVFKVPALSEAIFSSGHIGESMTWIDSLYFVTVTVTTVGFGDITPQTSGGKYFIAIYIVVTCVWVASVLGQFIDLYVNDFIGERIVEQILTDVTFVHKCDLAGNGNVSTTEYLLFKLQELQMVDHKILDILSARFDEIDGDNNLALIVGTDIPSAEQVAQLTEEVAWWNPKKRTMMDAWEIMQGKIRTGIERSHKYDELMKWAGVIESTNRASVDEAPLVHSKQVGNLSSRANPVRKSKSSAMASSTATSASSTVTSDSSTTTSSIDSTPLSRQSAIAGVVSRGSRYEIPGVVNNHPAGPGEAGSSPPNLSSMTPVGLV